MMRMLGTQRLRHLQLVSLSSGCAMVIRFVCDSKYMKAFTFAYYNTIYSYTYFLERKENLRLFYDAYNLLREIRSCLLISLMLHYSMLMKYHFATCMFVILDCVFSWMKCHLLKICAHILYRLNIFCFSVCISCPPRLRRT